MSKLNDKQNQGKVMKPALSLAPPEWEDDDNALGSALLELQEELRQTYLGIIQELSLDLNQEYQQEISYLRKEVLEAKDLRCLLALRGRLEAVVRHFAGSLAGTRERAAQVIDELLQHLKAVELLILESIGNTAHLQKERDAFADELLLKVDDIQKCVDGAGSIADMKKLLAMRLAAFRKIIGLQRSKEHQRLEQLQREVKHIRQKFDDVRQRVSYLKRENSSLADQVRIDYLTRIPNRRALEERLEIEMARFKRHGHRFSLALMDMDNFKDINDNFGHPVGDRCLVEVAERLRQRLRTSDMVARYGGDEFVILLPETSAKQAVLVAELLRKHIEDTEFTVRNLRVPVTVSLGVTQTEEDDQEVFDVLERADRALYQAKIDGRNRVVRF